MRAMLCPSLCNCRHSLRAEVEEELVEVAFEHLRQRYPAAPLEEERLREVVFTRAYDIEYALVYAGGAEPDEEFGPEPYQSCGEEADDDHGYGGRQGAFPGDHARCGLR